MLRPFKIAIKGLSLQDATILKEEQSMKSVMIELKSQSSMLALKLFQGRLGNCRIKYLKDPEVLKDHNMAKNVNKLKVKTFERLYPLKVANKEIESFQNLDSSTNHY